MKNFQVNANISLAMQSSAVKAVLPTTSQSGDLKLGYNINQPEFVASTLKLYNHFFYIFGIVVTIYMFAFYFVKSVIIEPRGRDKGELIAHILLLKTPVLMVYPSYAEMINYCSGFMVADFPWLNSFFGEALSEPTDVSPYPYLLFYSSLSIGSTYMLALLVLVFTTGVLSLVAYLKKIWRPTIINIGWFLYNFFIAGLALAAVLSIQGALLNILEDYTRKSNLYMLGFLIFFIILIEALHSTYYNIYNMYKLRIFVKIVIISILHYNSLYLFSIVLGF